MITAYTNIFTSGVFSGEKYCIRDDLESRYWVQAQCCPAEGALRQIWNLQKDVVDVAVAACDRLLLWLVVCTFFSVTWSHVELLAEPRTLYLTWIIPLQIGTAENILGFSRNVSLFSPPARLASAAACCLFAACSLTAPVRPPFVSLWFTHVLHWVNFLSRKGAAEGLSRAGKRMKGERCLDKLRRKDAIC